MNTSIINKFYIWKNYKEYQQNQQQTKPVTIKYTENSKQNYVEHF